MSKLLSRLSLAGVALAAVSVVGGATAADAAPAPRPAASTVKPLDVCNFTTARPTIRRGSTGNAVRQAQCYLNLSVISVNLTIDGDFGPRTDAAVRLFQSCDNITIDGIVGPVTWRELNRWANSPNFVC